MEGWKEGRKEGRKKGRKVIDEITIVGEQ